MCVYHCLASLCRFHHLSSWLQSLNVAAFASALSQCAVLHWCRGWLHNRKQAQCFWSPGSAVPRNGLDAERACTCSQVRSLQPEAVDAAVAALRYGSICVNSPTLMGFCLTKTTWGAFPGGTPQVRPQNRLRPRDMPCAPLVVVILWHGVHWSWVGTLLAVLARLRLQWTCERRMCFAASQRF